MSLDHDLLRIEKQIWNGGPEDYRAPTDNACLIAFTVIAGLMSPEDISKSVEAGRWRDVSLKEKGMYVLCDDAAVIALACIATRKAGQSPIVRW